MKGKIGIPRGMMYYELYPEWEGYFRSLNFDLITSPRTNKEILDIGIFTCVDEACLPVKIFHGHVDYLKDKVDYIFIPKITSLCKGEYNCPKILGLPDMIKHSIGNLPPVIDTEFQSYKRSSIKRAYNEIGKSLECNSSSISKAYRKALDTKDKYIDRLEAEILSNRKDIDSTKLNLLILGHPYVIFDEFLNMGILNKLIDNKVNIVFPEDVEEKDVLYYSNLLPKRMFWTEGRRIVGSAFSLIDKQKIDGIIYLSSFGCGLDSVFTYIISRKAKERNIPIMELTLDEQTGEAGFNTRLEAYLDMMKWRNKNENYLSSLR